jgi:2-methylisocitrate lyase-like PEP mutase family enzyme
MPDINDLPLGLRPVEGRHRELRRLLAGGPAIVAPGAFDCISARLVESAGFPALYVTGSGVSMSVMGAPDVGVISFAEILDRIRHICDVVSIPVIADADTGYGGPLNVMRTVIEYERAGVSAIQIEDQEWPKRCGHEPGRRLVPAEEMVARIAAACAARRDPDVCIIARTDARSTEGLEEALRRGRLYREAGADIVFIESPESEAELAQIGRSVEAPLLANMVEGGRTPILPADRLAALGFRLVIFPNALTRLFAKAGLEMLDSLRETGSTNAVKYRMFDHRQLWDLFENQRWTALQDRFAPGRNG